MVRARILVSGLVQGVSYRHCTSETATTLGIKGWVRNLPDGKVEILAEGTKDRVERFISWCHRGSLGARVAGVQVSWEPYEGNCEEFVLAR